MSIVQTRNPKRLNDNRMTTELQLNDNRMTTE